MLDQCRTRSFMLGLYFLGVPFIAATFLLAAFCIRMIGTGPMVFAYLKGWPLFVILIYFGIICLDYSKAFIKRFNAAVAVSVLIILGALFPYLINQLNLQANANSVEWPVLQLSGLVMLLSCHMLAACLIIHNIFKGFILKLWKSRYRHHLLAHAPFLIWTLAWLILFTLQGYYLELFGTNMGLSSDMIAFSVPYYFLGWLCCAFNISIFWTGLTIGIYDYAE